MEGESTLIAKLTAKQVQSIFDQVQYGNPNYVQTIKKKEKAIYTELQKSRDRGVF